MAFKMNRPSMIEISYNKEKNSVSPLHKETDPIKKDGRDGSLYGTLKEGIKSVPSTLKKLIKVGTIKEGVKGKNTKSKGPAQKEKSPGGFDGNGKKQLTERLKKESKSELRIYKSREEKEKQEKQPNPPKAKKTMSAVKRKLPRVPKRNDQPKVETVKKIKSKDVAKHESDKPKASTQDLKEIKQKKKKTSGADALKQAKQARSEKKDYKKQNKKAKRRSEKDTRQQDRADKIMSKL